MDRQKLLKDKIRKWINRIPLALTLNRTLSNVKTTITNTWNFFHINQEFKYVFQGHQEFKYVFEGQPILAFRRNKNLYDLLECYNIEDRKLQRQSKKNTIGFSTTCFSKSGNMCCKHFLHMQSFKSSVTHQTFHIFDDLDCKSKLLVYLMECRICRMEYVWKSKIEFNFKLNNHRKGVNRQNAPQADMHFNLPSHNFRQHARFTLSKLALWPSNNIW